MPLKITRFYRIFLQLGSGLNVDDIVLVDSFLLIGFGPLYLLDRYNKKLLKHQ